MKDSEQLTQSLSEVWEHHLGVLRKALGESLEGMENLLRLDEYQRHGHDQPQLQETLGPFGSQSLNLSALSNVLDKSSSYRRLSEERLGRIHALIERLRASREALAEIPGSLPEASLEDPWEEIHGKVDAHLNKMAGIFRDLRMAPLEIRGKDTPLLHAEAFESFCWRDLNEAELRLCPPFVVHAVLGPGSGESLRKILALLECGKPLKIVAFRSTLAKTYEPSAALEVPSTLAVEMVPLAMRGITFLQSCGIAEDFAERLGRALASPQAALISLLAEKPGEEETAYAERARGAVRSRAFPLVSYHPDHASGFVACLDLSSNPPQEAGFTFAEFAAAEEEFASGFMEVPEGATPADLVPVGEFLRRSPQQRAGKYPCLHLAGKDGADETRVLTPNLVTQIADQEHLWKTLQEIAGEDHPSVAATRTVMKAEFGAQQESLRASLTAEMEKQGARRERLAVANVVRNLSARLTGADPSVVDLEALLRANNDSASALSGAK